MSDLLDLLSVFARLSLVAFGGGVGILPEMERQVVGARGWVTHQQFVDAFALSQVTPGPGMLMVAMIGYRAAGPAGAAVACLGMFGPAATVTWLVADRWSRLGDHPAVALIRATMGPVALGLLGAGASLRSSASVSMAPVPPLWRPDPLPRLPGGTGVRHVR